MFILLLFLKYNEKICLTEERLIRKLYEKVRGFLWKFEKGNKFYTFYIKAFCDMVPSI